jgi:5-methylcytosine-specific restriction endonuclease McrA
MHEFDLIKKSKITETRNRLDILTNRIRNHYNRYENQFDVIQNISVTIFSDNEKNDLISCYTVKTKARNDLLKRIIDNQIVEFKHTCAYCLYHNWSTYDHYIPEGSFPEFSVLVKNLIPCCAACNSKKNAFWRVLGERKIIHFYNDLIPEVVFLKATLKLGEKNIPSISYSLIQPDSINDNLFRIIQGHYFRLELLELYRKNTDLVISTITLDIEINKDEDGNKISTEIISKIISKKSSALKKTYGINYWQSIAMDLIAATPEFINNI